MEHNHEEVKQPVWGVILSAVMLLSGILFDATEQRWFATAWLRYAWYIAAFLPVGLGILKEAVHSLSHKALMGEHFLMSAAAVGAFAIGELPEAVAVMLLYSVGEALQDHAVDRARDNIKAMMAFKPQSVRVVVNGQIEIKKPEEAQPGDIIEVLPGEQVPLDGCLLSPDAAFNTAALTGESLPQTIATGAEVAAGMIATDTVVRLKVLRQASQSAITRILKMVEEAAERKAPTERFIRRFARIYTPVVVALAGLTVLIPFLYSLAAHDFDYHFSTWLNRALVFLVISCPCALVISIPLSYFAAIGKAAKHGILFKGSSYIDALTHIDTVVFDKTGTLTTGTFTLQEVAGLSAEDLRAVGTIEQNSTHPLAKAVLKGIGSTSEPLTVEEVKNIPGGGMAARVQGDSWLVGTPKLLGRHGVTYPSSLHSIANTLIACAKNGQYLGYITLADEPKADARQAIERLKAADVAHIEILSGDKQPLVTSLAHTLGIETAHGELLPEGKMARIEQLRNEGRRVAFVGDGINDAPVLALSDVGVAMGSLGSDMAVETADVVLQADRPMQLATAVELSHRTRRVIWQNVLFSIGIKVLIMLFSVLGFAHLWLAIFADTGVALLAVLNAVRGVKINTGKAESRL